MSEGGLAGTAFVDLEPRFGAGFAGALAGKLKSVAGPAAVIAAGAAVFGIGEKFEGLFNKIKVQTGAAGGAFNSLKDSAKNVLAGTAGTFDQVSAAVGGLYQRTHLTGSGLDDLAKKEVSLARITKTDVATNVEATTSLFNRYGVATKDQSKELDVLFKASQAGGKGLAALVADMQKGAPALTAFGFGIDKSAALIGGLERAGVNVAPVLTGLRTGFGKIAKEGGDPQKVLAGVFKELKDGKDPTKATADALALFGARGGKELADAVRSGRFDVDALFKTITNGKGGINETATEVSTLGGKFAHLKNIALVAIEPIATKLVDLANNALAKVVTGVTAAGPIIAKGWDDVLGGFQNPDAKVGPGVGRLERILIGVGSTARKVSSEASKDWRTLLTGLSGGDTSGASGIAGAFGKAGAVIRTVVTGIIADATKLGPVLVGAFNAVKSVDFKAIFGQVRGVVAGVITAVKGIDFESIFGRLKAIIAPILPPLLELGRAVISLAIAAFPVLLHAIRDVVGFAIRLRPVFLAIVAVGYVLARVAGVVIAGALKIVAAAVGLLAHHAGILRPILLALVGGFVALKVVQGVQAGILGAARAAGTAVGTFQRLGGQAATLFKSGSDTLRLRLMYLKDGALKVGGGLKTAASAVADFAKSALSAVASIAKQTAAFVAQKVASVATAIATKAMAAAQWLLNAAMDANPITLIVIGLAALAAGVVLAYQHFAPFRDVVDAVGRALAGVARVITSVVTGAFDWIKSHWPLLLAILTGPFGIAVLLITRNWHKITEGASTAFHAITGFFTKLPGRILGALGDLGGLLLGAGRSVIRGLLRGVTAGATLLWDFYVKLPIKIAGYFAGAVGWLLSKGRDIITGLFNGITKRFLGVLSWVGGIEDKIVGGIVGAATALFDTGVNFMQGLWNGLKSMVGKIGDWIGKTAGHFVHKLTHPWELLSPSRLTFRIGAYFMQGLHLGLISETKGALDHLEHFAKAAVDAVGIKAPRAHPITVAGHTGHAAGGKSSPTHVSAERFRALVLQGLLGIAGTLELIHKDIPALASSGSSSSSSDPGPTPRAPRPAPAPKPAEHHLTKAERDANEAKALTAIKNLWTLLGKTAPKPKPVELVHVAKVDPKRFAGVFEPPPPPPFAPAAAAAAHHLIDAVPAHHAAAPIHQENHFHGHEKPTTADTTYAGHQLAWLVANTGRRP